MAKTELMPFGLEIKINLLNLGKNQNWLIREVREKIGLYFDSSYLRMGTTTRMTG